jgi:hypothetical protein
MRCDHEHDDGSYVLGALSPAERTAYERHLSTCSFCREAVADLAVIPGLLGRLDPADFARLLEPDGPRVPAQRDRIPALVTAAQVSKRREHRRGRRRTFGSALVAATVTLVVGAGGVTLWQRNTLPDGTNVALKMESMRPLVESTPVSAQVNLTSTAWGTKVTMKCAYQKTGASTRAYTFRLMAFGPDDRQEQISSWVAAPGAELKLEGSTSLSTSEISRIELIRYDDTPILAYDVP